jgi:mannose-6-phosphate isomerase-like protein (cupin superfamily)
VSYTLLNRDQLPYNGNTYEFQGFEHDVRNLSFIWVDMPPGGTIRLHKHPYEEIFIIQEGIATFTVGSARLEARGGQIMIVPAEVPHRFMNWSDKQLRQIDIHVNNQFVTHWLDD